MATVGNNIIVQIQNGNTWSIIGAARTDEIQVDGELMEVANKTSGQWRQFIAGRKTWSVQTNHLVTNAANVRELLQAGTRVKLRIGPATMSTGEYVTGFAWIKSQKLSAPINGLATGVIVFQGDGALE